MSLSSSRFFRLLPLGFVGLVASTLGVGCAAAAGAEDESASTEAALTTSIAPGEYALYSEPGAQPRPSCDVHTALSLSSVDGARAALGEVVTGTCEIDVELQPREYTLRLEETSCGSKVFKGSVLVNDALRTITITDHRARSCRDQVPAQIIVEEADVAGRVQLRYSLDAQ